MQSPTVKIVDPDKPDDYIVINAEDFDPRHQVLLDGEVFPDGPVFRKRKHDNMPEYHRAVIERAEIQEETNRDYSNRALGILTFSSAVFALTIGDSNFDGTLLMSIMVSVSFLVFILVCFYGFRTLYLKLWQYPCDFSDLDNRIDKHDPDVFMEEMAYAYADAVDHNQDMLDSKAGKLQKLTVFATCLVIFCLSLLSYPFWKPLLKLIF